MFNKLRKKTGLSLIEAIISIALIALILPSVILMLLGSHGSTERAEDRLEAAALAQEAFAATRSIRDYSWNNLIAGTHGLTNAGGYWELSGSDNTIGAYTRSITITDLSAAQKEVVVNLAWTAFGSINNNLSYTTHLTNWAIQALIQTTEADFLAGLLNSVTVTNNAGGEVELSQYTGWSSYSTAFSEDLSGNDDILNMLIHDNLLFVAKDSGAAELEIWDIADISNGNFTQLITINLSAALNDLAFDQDYFYFATADGSAEVQIYDRSSNTQVNTIDLSATANTIAINDTDLYVGTANSSAAELLVFDLTDTLSAITELDATTALEAGADINDFALGGTHLFAATAIGSQELVSLNLTTKTISDTLDLTGTAAALGLDLNGDTLYLARASNTNEEFYAISVSNPASLSISNSANLTDTALSVATNGQYAFVGTDNTNAELLIYDLDSFTLTNSIDLTSGTSGNAVAEFGQFVYIGTTDNNDTLQVLQPDSSSAWGSLAIAASYNADGAEGLDATDVTIVGDYAYLSTLNNSGANDPEFYIIDISNPLSPSLVGNYDVGDSVNALAISGNYAYLATDSNSTELVVLNISNPAAISLAGTYNVAGNDDGLSVAANGTTVYFGTARDNGSAPEFFVFDASSPASISQQGSINYNEDITDIFYKANYAYLAQTSGSGELTIVNVLNPILPLTIGQYGTPSRDATSVFVDSSNRAFLTTINDNSADFFIVNVAVPALPTTIATLDLNDNNDVYVLGDYAFVVTDENNAELQIIDISTIAAPVVVNTFDLDNDARAIFATADYLYIASESDSQELQIVSQVAVSSEYSEAGIFTSSAIDSGSASTNYSELSWTTTGTGTVYLQLRTADSEANLATATWVGSDGTNSSYYTTSETAITLDPNRTGTRFLQYRVFLIGDSTTTPIFNDITITYN